MEQRREPARGVLSAEVAVVTGAGRGVGRAIAQELAAAGASVVLSAGRRPKSMRSADAIAEAGGRSLAVPTDVTDEEQVERLMRATRRRTRSAHAACEQRRDLEVSRPRRGVRTGRLVD